MTNLLENSIQIRTGSRLHFGPLSFAPKQGRHFGGIGLMIDGPNIDLTLKPSNSWSSSGSLRTAQILARIESERLFEQPVHIDVKQEIPPHRGLGSGTQLTLAVLEGISRLNGQFLHPTELARLAGRAERSAIGMLGYELGGFLVDAGRNSEHEAGTLAARVAFPEHWKILLICPKNGEGISGETETHAFQNLHSMTEEISGRMSRLTLTEILPALHSMDLPAFNAALHEFGCLAGSFFSKAQSGIFSNEVIRKIAELIPAQSLGMAQSSWGPTVALFVDSEQTILDVQDRIHSAGMGSLVTYQLTTGRNFEREFITQSPTSQQNQ